MSWRNRNGELNRGLVRLALRSFLGRPGRTAAAVAAVAMSVALAVALTGIGAGYQGYRLHQARVQGGYFDLYVRELPPQAVGEVQQAIQRLPGVDRVAGSAALSLKTFGAYDLVALGFDQPEVLSGFVNRVAGRMPTAPGEVLLEEWAARELGVGVGDTLCLDAESCLRVVGLAEEMPGSRPLRRAWGLTSLTTLEMVAGEPVPVAQLQVLLEPGVDLSTAHRRIAAQVGGRGRVDVNQPLQEARQEAAGATRTAAALAVLTVAAGLFITLNTFQISLTERIQEVGTLKALGMGERQLAGVWLAEGLLTGMAGGLLGSGLGAIVMPGLAHLASRLGAVPAPATAWPTWTLPAGVGAGVTVALAAAWLPARAAARMSVLAAMQPWRAGEDGEAREDGEAGGREGTTAEGRPTGARGGVLLAVLGLVLIGLLALLGDEHPLGLPAGLMGLLLAVAGVGRLTPALLPVLLGGLGRPRGGAVTGGSLVGTGRRRPGAIAGGSLAGLARLNLLRHRRRTAGALSALLLAVTLVTAAAGVVHGRRLQAEAELRERVPTDYVVEVSTRTAPGGVSPAVSAEIGRWPEVAGVATVKVAHALMQGFPRDVPGRGQTIILGIDPAVYSAVTGFKLEPALVAALAEGQAIITRRLAAAHGLQNGEMVTVQRRGRRYTWTVAGIIDRETEVAMGAILVDKAHLVRLEGDDREHRLLIQLAPGADAAAFHRRLQAALTGVDALVLNQQDERARMAREAAEALSYVVAMGGLIGLMAVSALVNTLLAVVRERRRELGVLMSLGLSRGRVGALIGMEAAWLGLLAAVQGLVLGSLAALVAGWGLSRGLPAAFLPPLPSALATVLGAILLGSLASLVPAWMAARIPPAELLRSE